MATVGKNIHKQRMCTVSKENLQEGRIQPYLTLFPFFATEKLSVSAFKEDWQRAAKKIKGTVMRLLFYLSFCV